MRFYTWPRNIGEHYPFLLLNVKLQRILGKAEFQHAILDAGVMIFANHAKEYPEGFMEKYEATCVKLHEKFNGRVWYTIPDYPDDYHPGEVKDTVAKTLRNIRGFTEHYPKVPWLPVLQATYQDRFSFLESCQQTRKLIGDYPRIAIGTVCKCRRLEYIAYCCRMARSHFPNSWIHAFGLTLKAVPKVKNHIDSFDSMAWTYPREHGGHSAKTNSEAKQYFHAYLTRVEELIGGN
jgi:hypothetical protein